jgi:hypothetical protein
MIANKEIDLSLFDFQTHFSTEKDCLEYLSTLKWEAGFEYKNANIPITVKALTNLIDNVPDAVP